MRYIFIILMILLQQGVIKAEIIHVGPGHQYKTIKAGLAASRNGDTVMVEPGMYREQNIVIDKSIWFIGKNLPVLDGEKKYEVISVKANKVVVDGFRVIRSGVSSIVDMGGIKIYDAREVTIRNNIIEDTFFGIYIQYGAACVIQNNKISSNQLIEQQSGNGIHCWKSDSLLIRDNTISGHRDGMYFEFATNSTILSNSAVNNLRYGLHFMFSHNNFYISNLFKNNGAGVAVMYSKEVKMYNNTFQENWGDAAYGLLLKELTDSYIEHNIFVKNTVGIYVDGSSRLQVKKNIFRSNGWAMKIQASCMEVKVNSNNFLGNTFDVGTNGNLMLNNFDGNYWDKYEGYDLDKNKVGDIPYRPVSLFAMIIEQNPPAMILFRSFMSTLLDKTEKVLPTLTPENLKDEYPLMKALKL